MKGLDSAPSVQNQIRDTSLANMEEKTDNVNVRVEALSKEERDTLVLAKLGKKSVMQVGVNKHAINGTSLKTKSDASESFPYSASRVRSWSLGRVL